MKTIETITSFLEENENYKKIKYLKLDQVIDISQDDEVWLFQCPKKIDISTIEGCKIKLPGKTNINSLELIVEESSTPTSISFATVEDSGKINLKSIKVHGGMILRKRIEVGNAENDIDINKTKLRVPFPTDIKERHPLHGISYEEKIIIKKSIKDRLRKVDKISKKFKIKTEKDKCHNIEQPSEIYNKKSKKKRKYSETEIDIPENVANIENIKVECDENDTSLNWLKNI